MTAPPTGIPVPQITYPAAEPPPSTPSIDEHLQTLSEMMARIDAEQKVRDAEIKAAEAADAKTAAADAAAAETERVAWIEKFMSHSAAPSSPDAETLPNPATVSVQDSLQFDPMAVKSYRQADTRPPDRHTQDLPLLGALIAIMLIAAASPKWWPQIKAQLPRLLRLARSKARKHAPLILCLGVALVAADWLLFDNLIPKRTLLHDGHRNGAISFAGVSVALIGFYHWITGPPGDKI